MTSREALAKFTGRYSRFKNAFGTPCTPANQIVNLSVNLSAASAESTVVACNDRFFAVPWKTGGGGAFNVLRHSIDDLTQNDMLNNKGKLSLVRRVPLQVPICTGHSSNICDLAFSPFNSPNSDHDILATSSVDSTINIWNVPSTPSDMENLNKTNKVSCIVFDKDMNVPNMSLNGHEKKVHLIQFHPLVSNVLCSASVDETVKLWDLEKSCEKQSLTGFTSFVQNMDWNYDGSHVVTSCKDKILRLYDPRKNTVVVSGEAHEGAKGFRVSWIGKKDQFFTVGFNKTGQRQLKLWDLRKGMKRGVLTEQIIDSAGASQLIPFIDPGNCLIYLAGRGDSVIRIYEVDDSEAPFVHYLTEYKGKTSQTGLAMLPRRVCDVKKFEIAKFIKLCGDNMIETVSFTVPRKTTKTTTSSAFAAGQEIFQEELFLPVLSRSPSIGGGEWFSGSEAEPLFESLKPSDMVSSFSVPSEAGNSKMRSQSVMGGAPVGKMEGFLHKLNSKQTDSWDKRYFSLKKDCLVYAHDKSLLVKSRKIMFSEIISVHHSPVTPLTDFEQNSKGSWFQINTLKRVHHIIASNPMECAKWVESIQQISGKPEDSGFMQDHLLQLTITKHGRVQGTLRRWVCVWEHKILIFAQQRNPTPLVSISIEKELHNVQANHSIQLIGLSPEERKLCLLIETKKGEKYYLLANSETQKENWIDYIQMSQLEFTVPSDLSQSSLNAEMKLLVSLGFARVTEGAVSSESVEPQGKIKAHPIPETLSKEDVQTLFTVFGKIVDIELKRDGKFKDALFITYEKKSSAESALRLDNAMFDGQTIHVEELELRESLEVAFLKVEDIHEDVTMNDFRSIFQVFGEIDMIKLWPEKNGKNGLYGYMKFVDSESAKQAIMLNGAKFMGQEIKVKLLEKVTSEEKLFVNMLDPTEVKQGNQQVLIQIKGGKSKIRSSMVEFSPQSLNSGDVYILDAGKVIFQWNGKDATRFEKARGLDVSSNLRVKERGGNAKCFVLNQQEEVKDDADVQKNWKQFWQLLCKTSDSSEIERQKKLIRSQSEGGADEIWSKLLDEKVYLYRIGMTSHTGNHSGKFNMLKPFQGITFKCVWSRSQPSKNLLQSEFAYVLDCFSEVFIWEGKDVKSEQRQFAKYFSMKLLQQDNRPVWSTVTRVLENGETVLFKEKFYDYGGMLPIAVSASDLQQGKESGTISTAKPQPSSANLVKAMLSETAVTEDMFEDSNLDGEKIIYRVEGFEKSPVDGKLQGHFFSADSFVILYKYRRKNRDSNLIYFWQGRDSSINEKGASALLTIDLSKETGGDALQIRILQQKETKHFLSIFSQGVIIHQGKLMERMKSGFNASNSYYMYDVRYLYEDKGETKRLRAVEVVKPSARYLNSNHTFVIFVPSKSTIFIWSGKYSAKEELDFSRYVSQELIKINELCGQKQKIQISEIKQGGGNEEVMLKSMNIMSAQTFMKSMQEIPCFSGTIRCNEVRLYMLSIATGVVEVERVFNWCQDDMDNSNVMVLDCRQKVYIWFGSQSVFMEQKVAVEAVLEYVKKDSKGRPTPIEQSIFITLALQEPTEFKNLFQAWGEYKVKALRELSKERSTTQTGYGGASASAKVGLQKSTISSSNSKSTLIPVQDKLSEYQRSTYSYEDLLAENYPPSVDKSKLETYLTDEEFEKVFSMKRSDYQSLPEWKQSNLKKSAYLF